MTDEQFEAVATKIAAELFTNAVGVRAHRLVLSARGTVPHDPGGYSERAVSDVIFATLRDAFPGETSPPQEPPDGLPAADVLAYLLGCAERWVPDARILGNARAGDVARACREALETVRAKRAMTKGELLDMLVSNLKEYRGGCRDSLTRNGHMHEASRDQIHHVPSSMLDALLVDFVNFVGVKQGIDLALYAKDVRE